MYSRKCETLSFVEKKTAKSEIIVERGTTTESSLNLEQLLELQYN